MGPDSRDPAAPGPGEQDGLNAQQPPQDVGSRRAPDAGAQESEAKRRERLQTELDRLGISAEEVRRLLGPDPAAGQSERPASSAEALAAQLLTEQAEARIQAIDRIDLGLPPPRQAAAQDKVRADQLLRDAALMRRREKYREAEAKCREAIAMNPGDASAWEMLGDILQGVARVDEALAAYRGALKADPKRAASERKFADLLMRQQNWAAPDPESVPAARWLAVLLSLVMPGAGQVYNGEVAKGIVLFLLEAACVWELAWSPWGFVAARGGLRPGVVAPLVLAIVIYLGGMVDASLGAGRKQRASRTGWNV